MASHAIPAVLGGYMAARRGGHWIAPAFVGFLLGWGTLPLIWLLTREPRPEIPVDGSGLNPSEPATEGSDWDEWLNYYFNLRQDLVIQVILLVVCLLYVMFLVAVTMAPELLASVFFPLAENRRLASLLWTVSQLWPTLAGCLLLSNYRFPWLGPVWRYADEIWQGSGLPVPAEVSWRSRGATLPQEEARVALLEAVRRSRMLHTLTLALWLTMVVILGLTIVQSLLALRH